MAPTESADDGHDLEDFEELLALQRVDSRIQRIQHTLDNLDAQQSLDETRERIREIEEQQADHRVDLDRAEAEQRKVEGQVEDLNKRLSDEQQRMYSGDIHNPKELQSIRAEIESTQRRIEDQEDKLLKVMEVIDRLETEIDELEERKDELEAEADELSDQRDEDARGLLAERAELETERDGHRESLPDDLLERYDRALEDHSGLGVAELDGGMCTGCRIELPMVDQEDLLEGDPLQPCPSCGRLLVVP